MAIRRSSIRRTGHADRARVGAGLTHALGRLIRFGFVVWFLTAALVSFAAVWAGSAYPVDRATNEPLDAIIVLGGGIDPDGEMAFSTRRRVRAGVRALAAGHTRALIFAGGSRPGETADAERMAGLAVEEGAAPDRLVLEDRSRTTFENLRFAFQIADAQGFARVGLLTDTYHLPRAAALARYFGRSDLALFASTGLARDEWHEQAHSISREALAWWYNLGKVAVWEGLAALGWDEAARAQIVQ